MASRRIRIKGIANIPQRRKPETTQNPEPELLKTVPEIERSEENEDKPNLITNEHVIQEFTNEHETPSENTKTVDEIDSKIVQESPVKEKMVIDENVPPSKPPQMKVVRRQLLKPSVSRNAIVNGKIRKEEPNETEQVSQQSQKENKKIVILNEVITNPRQSEEVTIVEHMNQGEEKIINNLEEPEVEITHMNQGNIVQLQPINSIEGETKKPDIEYPVPPPSPTKVNRARIKAVPRLNHRHTSFSASESEDESRKQRHRNDSVCSTTSGIHDNSSISECMSPQKPKEFNSVIQRKCRRTEQSRKLAEARRDFMLKFPNNKPDKKKLTLIDLIFYNPTTNPMSSDGNKQKNEIILDQINKDKEDEEAVDDPNKSGSDEENEMPAPQIKIGPGGELIIDEKSLVIENKSLEKEMKRLESAQAIDTSLRTQYGIYKRAKRSKDWTKQETLKFYRALNTIGTDFTLMCELFPRRSRRELKMKFKKEERINKNLIDRAIMEPCNFDFNDFKHEVEMEEKELLAIQKQKEREQQLKLEAKRKRKLSVASKNSSKSEEKPEKIPKQTEKPRKVKKPKPLDIMTVLDDEESDADESEVDSNYEDGENTILKSLQKPTRSGRVPKILTRYNSAPTKNVYESPSPKPEPGSLMVVSSMGPKGDPVYNVYMVTGEQDRQQIGEGITSLAEAMKFKGNLQSIFTVTASQISEENQEIPPENNVTISHENEKNGEDVLTSVKS